MKRFAKLLGLLALVAVIGFSMVSCKNDDDDAKKNGGATGWNGDYFSIFDEKTTVDLNAKTITGGSILSEGEDWWRGVYDANLSIPNVTIGEVHSLEDKASDLTHSGNWAYVYSDGKKIGVINSWVMSHGGGNTTPDYYLIISGDKSDIKITGSSGMTQTVLDLNDLVHIGVYIDANKDG